RNEKLEVVLENIWKERNVSKSVQNLKQQSSYPFEIPKLEYPKKPYFPEY
ncbi:24653_t:CDS:1, partial [Racocetra persica]